MTIPQEKTALRQRMRALRAGLGAADRARLSAAATDRLLGLLPSLPEGPVACFRSLGDEIDTEGLLAGLAARGRAILLPRVVGRGRPLALHLWAPGQPLVAGGFGLREPPADAPMAVPAVVVTPLLAIDRGGYRVGYGAGFYDRTLGALVDRKVSFVAVGFAFEMQRVEMLPVEATDVPLDLLVTEAGVTRFGRSLAEGG